MEEYMDLSRSLNVEVHAVQNFTTNNLNRDDVGSPKDCVFGGVRRSRISSQAWKRAIRTNPLFKEAVLESGGDVGVRTRKMKDELIQQLMRRFQATQEQADILSDVGILKVIGIKLSSKKKNETEYLLYIGANDIAALAENLWMNKECLLENPTEPDKKVIKGLKSLISSKEKSYAADVALFGRMFADDKTLNVDAACQVAHSISSHKVAMDIDYFTAVDDLNSEGDSGAGMIGYTEMNGSCHYRYANVNVPMLFKNLGYNSDLTAATVKGFIESFIESLPTGKQNSMAAHNPPYSVMVIIRESGRLWNLAGAFSRPLNVKDEKSIEQVTTDAMNAFWDELAAAYGVSEDLIKTGFTLGNSDGSLSDTLETVFTSVDDIVSGW